MKNPCLFRVQSVAKGGFTLLELLCVISIMALVCALGIPALKAIADRQVITTISPNQIKQEFDLARAKAIATRLDTYILFTLQAPSANGTIAGIQMTTNEQTCQSYCLAQFGCPGDQPGQHAFRQISDWHYLPSGVFFNVQSFIDNQTPFLIAQWSADYHEPLNAIQPLPTVAIGGSSAMAGIGFRGGCGKLICGTNLFLPLVYGRQYYQLDGTATNQSYTVFHVDPNGFTHIEQAKVK